jgi:hypothetical protein
MDILVTSSPFPGTTSWAHAVPLLIRSQERLQHPTLWTRDALVTLVGGYVVSKVHSKLRRDIVNVWFDVVPLDAAKERHS